MKKIRFFSTTSQVSLRSTFEQYLQRNKIDLEDLYKFDMQNLDSQTANRLQKDFNGSLYNAVSTLFPEREWHPWKFQQERVPYSFWNEQSNQRKFFDDLGKNLGIQTLDDWYQKLSQNEMVQRDGGSLLKAYNNSPMNALMAAYPEHNWIPWKFSSVPTGFWNHQENQRKFFDWLGKELGIVKLDDWYKKISRAAVKEYASGLVALKQSATAALMSAYPEHNWMPWKFLTVPSAYWKSIENQRKYFDWLGKELGIQQLDDWYEKLSGDLIKRNGGSGLLIQEGSPQAALMAAYPEHNWAQWKFNCARTRWNLHRNVKEFLSELSEKLSIQTPDDWYRVNVKQLKQLGAGTLLNKYGGLYGLLKEQYPNHPWDPKRFQQTGKTQKWLAVTLKRMFPDEGKICLFFLDFAEILEDYQHPTVLQQISNRPLQLDVFIPSRSLAFEYQGQQHYEEVGVFSPTRTYQQRDEEKRNLCAANNIKLIEVPYWWNRTQESLQEIISKSVP